MRAPDNQFRHQGHGSQYDNANLLIRFAVQPDLSLIRAEQSRIVKNNLQQHSSQQCPQVK